MDILYQGWTPDVRKCLRCGRLEAMVNDLCFTCRTGDALAEWFAQREAERLACTCEYGSLGDGRLDSNVCPVHDADRLEAERLAERDRQSEIAFARMGY